jgi:crotonobetainyl-CoA:carnitine CoA-transferase CaiB-like acyl-CoA transferase
VRIDPVDRINARVADHMTQKETEAWYELFDSFGIWYAPVNSYEEAEKDPQVKWNESILTFDHPQAGTVRVLARPVRYDENAPPLRRIPPELGEPTEEILTELGMHPRRYNS